MSLQKCPRCGNNVEVLFGSFHCPVCHPPLTPELQEIKVPDGVTLETR